MIGFNEEGAMNMLTMNRKNGYLVLATLVCVILAGVVFLPAAWQDLINPRANFWRLVREGVPGYTAVTSEGHNVLIQTGGEIWREFRNNVLVGITPWLMGVVLAAIVLFHLITGGEQLPEPRSGIMFDRYNLGERVLHWCTALSFIVLALTGFSILLGRAVLIPLTGHDFFSTYLSISKIVHNWCGPLFLVEIILIFIIWLRDNFINKRDILWFKNMGGIIGGGEHPPAEKVNGGEKAWFWLITVFGAAMGISGVLIDFPIWEQTRLTMQVSLAVHAVIAVLFVTASLGHIYMGTVGSKGAFEGMWRGKVDAVWAKRHCYLWYKKKMEEEDLPVS